MTFEEELRVLIADARLTGIAHEQLERSVVELHRRYGREVPPPITGMLALAEIDDEVRGA